MRENEALHASARRDLAGGVRAGERVLRYASQVLVRRELRAREIAALQVQVGAGRDAYERIVHDAVATEREDLALGLDAIVGRFHDQARAYFGHTRADERSHCGLAFGTKSHVELVHAADEKVDHFGSSGRTEYGDRLPAARYPARNQKVRELADVVDVQMRDEERTERSDRKSLLRDALDRAAPDIEQ